MCIHAWIFLRVLRSQNQQLKKRIEQASLLSLAAIFDTLFSLLHFIVAESTLTLLLRPCNNILACFYLIII